MSVNGYQYSLSNICLTNNCTYLEVKVKIKKTKCSNKHRLMFVLSGISTGHF